MAEVMVTSARRAREVRLGIWIELVTVAGLVLIYFLIREGREALHEARTGETCDCCEAD